MRVGELTMATDAKRRRTGDRRSTFCVEVFAAVISLARISEAAREREKSPSVYI